MNEYMKDEELLQFIAEIESDDLVDAPPMIAEKVFEKLDKKAQILEYRKFRNRVIAAVACMVVIIFAVPAGMRLRPETAFSNFMQNEKQIDLPGIQMFGGLGNTHYISDFLNGREE